MKLTKQSNNLKSRIVSVLAIIALVLCTVLSFVVILPGRYVNAESGDAITAKREANGIKFVQVATGEDFAIGLTYDGKLYGWSYKTNRTPDSSDATLADCYTDTPTEIPVTFRVGPKNNFEWNATSSDSGEHYHSERTDDSIKAIAATRNTAAFITKKGYIYTWGKDTPHDVDHNESGQEHHLLLRSTTETDTIKCSWKIPYIIDYYYFGSTSATTANTHKLPLEQCIPSVGDGYTSLVGGEYNYAFMFIRRYDASNSFGNSGTHFHTYIWGSMLYNAVNTNPDISFSYDEGRITGSTSTSDARFIYNTFIDQMTNDAPTTGVSIVAGGYTVGINNRNAAKKVNDTVYGTSLSLRGRNFITTQGVSEYTRELAYSYNTGTGDDITGTYQTEGYKVQNTTQVLSGNADGIACTLDLNKTVDNNYGRATADITFSSATYLDAIAGGNGVHDVANGNVYGREREQYYARQKSSESLAYGIGNESLPLINSRGTSITGGLGVTRYAVSLGNDIGYGISGGNLYGWGDNANGQLQLDVESDPYKDLPTQLLTAKNATFISVAAGKQLSNDKAFSNGVTTLSGTAFADSVKNDDKYISAALTSTGTIYAWSKDIEATELYFQGIGQTEDDAQKKENFVAIYSGYGENLFAITASGKLVRITVKGSGATASFEQYTYDVFNDASGKKIDNWTINADKNRIVFTVPEVSADATKDQKVNPDLGSATFYVWSAAQSDSASELADRTIKINGNTNATPYNALIGANNIGDAYRIIGYNAKDKDIEFLKADKLSDEDKTKDDYYAPRYYFVVPGANGEKLMTSAQQANMFDAEVVSGANGEGIGIKITPKQSSKGKDIIVKFKIARYNNYDKYKVSGNTVTDNAIYYDYKECSITFKIDDSLSVLTYDAFTSTETSTNCGIPLLDPNNPYNKYYSLAVQDVSTGVDELANFLTGSASSAFKTNALKEMKKDAGFPDSDKKDKGNLDYYLNETDLGKYNDIYSFLYTDRDSDFIQISAPVSGIIGASSGLTGIKTTISVKAECALKTAFVGKTPEVINKTISTDFDNRYGLYDIAYSVEGGKGYVSFKYDVVRFEATGASGVIEYSSNAVTDYKTDRNSSAARSASIGVYTVVNYGYDDAKGYVSGYNKDNSGTFSILNGDNIISVFSNPTLRIGSYGGNELDINGQAGGGKNTYTVEDKTELYVGDTRTIELKNFVKILSNNICFSFENLATSDAYTKFGNQFTDATAHGVNVVKLSGSTIEISPTTDKDIVFTVAIQRFVDASKTTKFQNKQEAVDEKIFITFKFTNIIGFTLREYEHNKTEYLIQNKAGNAPTVIDLFGETDGSANLQAPFIEIKTASGGNLPDTAYRTLKNSARIYNVLSSEENSNSSRLFTAVQKGNTAIEITPLRSGSGVVQFIANIYDKSIVFTLTINVSSLIELDKANYLVTVDNDQYVYVSSLLNILRQTNSYDPKVNDYKPLYTDKGNAISFTDPEGNTGAPAFIQDAVFEDFDDGEAATLQNAYIRIISSNSSTVDSKTYNMHVKFTSDNVEKYEDAKTESIIDIIVPVESGRIKLQDKDTTNDIVAKINCRQTDEREEWWTATGSGLKTKVTINISSLLKRTKMQSPELYEILFVSAADSNAATYFNYTYSKDKLNIVITPKENTIDEKTNALRTYELNVSIYNKNNSFDTKVVSFEVSVDGIITTLPVMTEDGIIGYGNIWLYSFAIVFGVLLIIFVIRFIVYMRKRAKQRAIIKRNQDLIRLRDRMHGKANAATREQLVKSKLKMEDPKYAKMFNDMRRDKEDDTGVTLENSDLAATAEKKANKKKKKKGGKKTVAELKAELAAKKAAFAAAQAGNAQPVNPFATDIPMDGGDFVPPDGGFVTPEADGFGAPDAGFGAPDGGFGADGGFVTPDIDSNEIVFDASDLGDGNM